MRIVQAAGPTFDPNGFHRLQRPGPKSNAHRQREFRARNPGYYRKYHRRKKAAREAAMARQRQHAEAVALAERYPLFAEVILRPFAPTPPAALRVKTPNAADDSQLSFFD